MILFGLGLTRKNTPDSQKRLIFVTPIIYLAVLLLTLLGGFLSTQGAIHSVLWSIGEGIAKLGEYAIYLLEFALAVELLMRTPKIKPKIEFAE